MDYQRFSKARSEARAAFDAIEDWMAEVFSGSQEALELLMEEDDELDTAPAQQRRGMRFFGAGRVRDGRMFASMLFPIFRGDPHERSYREAVVDILRVAGGSVPPKTRHKLSFDLGVLYFTADARGNMYGVVASEDFPMATAFKFLEEVLETYDRIDISAALDKADSSLWNERQLREDFFGVRDLAIVAWKRHSSPGDGYSHDRIGENPRENVNLLI